MFLNLQYKINAKKQVIPTVFGLHGFDIEFS